MINGPKLRMRDAIMVADEMEDDLKEVPFPS